MKGSTQTPNDQPQKLIRLSDPMLPMRGIEHAVSVMQSGYLVQADTVKAFEDALSRYLELPYVILCSSGTAALHLALVALDIGRGDEVIIPAFTFPATANVVELVGAIPQLVDVSLSDCCIDPTLIEAQISSKTKAIMPVHEFGQPCNWFALEEIAKKYNLPIIEDAACAIGARYRDVKCGTLGAIGCFSLHPRKTLTTGEGGIVVTRDKIIAEKIAKLRNHGMQRGPDGQLDFVMPGFNYRLTEFQAALGLPQLEELDSQILHRQHLASLYESHLGKVSWLSIPTRFAERFFTYQTYHVLLSEKLNRAKVISMLREYGIESSIGAQAVHLQSYYRNKYGFVGEDFPHATRLSTSGLALPIGGHLADTDVVRIVEALISVGQQLLR